MQQRNLCVLLSLFLSLLSLSATKLHKKNGKGRFSRSAPHCHHRHLRTIIIVAVRLVTWSNCPHRPTHPSMIAATVSVAQTELL
ncbi:hypothetical protein M758_8G031600 [Ceratodon purpureus]|nr:hypothetical protein M758_8G031600 [Ceratodon purpureus]